MGVQIRVGYNDHQLVADFLANDPSGVSAITIDAKLTKRHRPAMEAARDAGITVLVETLTDRLAFAGYDPGPLDYADSYPLGRTALDTFTLRARFVESVVEPQAALGLATVTAPHFFADSADELRTNVELARLAVHEYAADQRVKAVCAVSRSLLAESNAAREAAELYGQAGVSGVELRLSPLGGAHESVQKIKATFDTLRAFGEFNVPVTLGYAGLIGEVAYALGLAEAFSTGVGDRERYDFKGAIANQKRLSTAKRSGEKRSSRGSPRRVLLPVAGLQVPRELARDALFRSGNQGPARLSSRALRRLHRGPPPCVQGLLPALSGGIRPSDRPASAWLARVA